MQFMCDVLRCHPFSATSWNLVCVKKVMQMPGVIEVRVDQCAYALESTDSFGRGLCLKPTRFMTSTPLLARILEEMLKVA